MKDLIKAITKLLVSEVNEGQYYIYNRVGRVLSKESNTFSERITAEDSFTTEKAALAYMEKNLDKADITEWEIVPKLESDFCSYGYWIDRENNNSIVPVYTTERILNRACFEWYHKNLLDAHEFVIDLPNREVKKKLSKIEKLKAQLAALEE